MTWRLVWTRPAAKDLKRLDPPVAYQIRERMIRLAETGQGDITRLAGVLLPAWRLRVGDWRVIFEYKHEHAVIEVLHVLGRDKAYKR